MCRDEPDQRLLVHLQEAADPRWQESPTRSRPRSASSTGARLGTGVPRRASAGSRADVVLRERRHPLRRRDVQAPGVQPAMDRLTADRYASPRDAASGSATGAGQLAGPDRRRSRNKSRIVLRGAGGHASVRAGPGGPAADLERGARYPDLDPAMVTAHPAESSPTNDCSSTEDLFDGSRVVEARRRARGGRRGRAGTGSSTAGRLRR